MGCNLKYRFNNNDEMVESQKGIQSGGKKRVSSKEYPVGEIKEGI